MKKSFSCAMIGRICVWGAVAALAAGCASKVPAPVVDRGRTPTAAAAAPATTYTVKSGDTLYSIARDHGMDHRELIALNNIENPNQISVGRVLKIRPAASATSSEVATTAPISSDVVTVRPIDGGAPVQASAPESSTATLKREPKVGKLPYSEEAFAKVQAEEQPKQVAVAPAASSAEPKPAEKVAEKPAEKPVETAPSSDAVPWIWPANGKIVATFSENGSKGLDIAGKAGDPVIAAADGKVVYSGTGLRGYGKLVIVKHNETYLSAYAHNQAILVKEGQSVTKGQKIAEMGNTDADQVKLHFEVRRQGKPVDPLKHLPPR